jgi:hypothetical protein
MGTYQVGDIVVCKAQWYHKTYNKRGFVEEVLEEPNGWKKGRYGIYGLDEPNSLEKDDMWFGDYNGVELEPTGERMNTDTIEKYMEKYPTNYGLQQDIKKVKALM